MLERASYLRPVGLTGIEALHARFVEHAYAPHSHPTWTVAVMQFGAAQFELNASQQRADQGELFVLEPDAVHTGMAAVPEGWGYQVLYLDPGLLHKWDERDGSGPRRARWVVFRDPALRAALVQMHASFAEGGSGLERDERVADAVSRLRVHLRPGPPAPRGGREHAAVRRARAHLLERWDQPVALADLAAHAGLSRFELIRRFRQQTGLTPHVFQTNLRIAQACERLRAGDPIAEVAAACGFADQPHLTRSFRRTVGVTPGRYAAA